MNDPRGSLTIERLSTGWNGQPVLREVTLTIPYGEFTALLGPNGSGKTTLLRTLAGILPPLSGQIRFSPVQGRAAVLGFVPQRETLDALYPVSGFDVALMGTYGRIATGPRVPRAEREFVEDCLDQVGAGELGRRLFSELSGGQKQRVLIARALATRPDFLLLDEPTAGIDSTTATDIMQLFTQLNRERKLSILMVNHDLSLVRLHARTVLRLRHGQAEFGPAGDLLAPARIAELFE